ncbi:MAG: FtsW/RodA/SpoVE family cell cycle protein [Pirellulales bacterium]|nr:FtsW/RodA/SpoVE family cell cycle protein [Pirellulales bacterium]
MQAESWAKRLSWSILVVAAGLILLGWLGITRYEDLVGDISNRPTRQLVWAAVAAVALLVSLVPSYRAVGRWSHILYILALLGLVAVYFFEPVNHARRWIHLGPVNCQPSEFAKVAYILAMARFLMYRTSHRRFIGLLLPFALTLAPMFLIVREPDLGTALVFVPVFFALLFAAGARWRDLLGLALIGLMFLPALWHEMSLTQRSRVKAVVVQAGPNDKPTDRTYQLQQAKQMLALGGVRGSWLSGQTVEDPVAYRLPEARTDFIFCVLGERFGLWGLGLVLAAYGLLVWRGAVIASTTREPFGRLLVIGVIAMFSVEVLINTGMNVGLLPITGLSLPLVSYGGSGLVAHALMLGLVLNVGLRPGYEMANEPFRYVRGEDGG